MIFFSVIIPTYNRAHLIENAINSVINQKYQNWELIIVDDGSTDNTKDIVEKFKDKRIKYFFQKNAERSAARNKGVEISNGEWICFLDSDDEYLPNHLETLYLNIINIDSIDFFFTSTLRKINKIIEKYPHYDESKNYLFQIFELFISPNQVCIKKSILDKNKFDIRFRLWEDTHLWIRLAAQYNIYQIKDYTVMQNFHELSSVYLSFKNVTISEVNQYINAIFDLWYNYSYINDNFSNRFFIEYADKKYKMYLYRARQNKQLLTSLKILFLAMINKPSFYLFMELPKIFLNKLKIGLNE